MAGARGRTRSPARASGRDTRVDLLRGVALLLMFVAHCAPSPGPLRLFALSEFATAPLFVLLIGVGAQLGDRGARGLPVTFVRAGIRAAVLVALGLWLDSWGAQVDIVLTSLALPTLLAPVLARCRTSVLIALATASWAAGPVVRDWGRDHRARALAHSDDLGAHLWDVVAAGEHYRFSTFLAFLCLGIVVWRAHATQHANVRSASAGLVAVLAAAGLIAAKNAGRIRFEPYSGDRLEVFFTLLLVGGLAAVWFAVVPKTTHLPALATAGSMTLSVYVVQIAYLAWVARALRPGEADDSWANVGVLCVAALALPTLWRSLAPREPWVRGPIEGPTSTLTRIVR